MKSTVAALPFHDYAPQTDTFREEVLEGLQRTPKTISSKFFYDERGSQLFDAITELDEYYLTRTELSIMQAAADEIAERLGPQCLVIEYGSGSSLKTRILLDHLRDPAAYMPIDISREHLMTTAERLAEAYPDLDIVPVSADYTDDFPLPEVEAEVARTVVYFPGSTIGNFTRAEAQSFLAHVADVCGPGGALLIGVDLKKDCATLEAAYDDRAGVTAAFNKNVLTHINHRLGANFDLAQFAHRAHYNAADGRIEMHLVSLADQWVHVDDAVIRLAEGEAILTEYSHKYSLTDFAALAEATGFSVDEVWTDAEARFSVQYLVVR